jgi:hypothetical protein
MFRPFLSRTRIAAISCVLALTPLGLMAAAGPAQAATRADGVPSLFDLKALGLTVGIEDSGDYLYATGPAAIVKLLCIDGVDIGAVCAFTGKNETGTGAFIVFGDNAPARSCADIPLKVVDSVNNVTNETLSLYSGTCAKRGAVDARVPSNTPENVKPADAFMFF